MSSDLTSETNLEEAPLKILAAWKFEALERCRAFDSGHLTERSAEDVMNDARRNLKQMGGVAQ